MVRHRYSLHFSAPSPPQVADTDTLFSFEVESYNTTDDEWTVLPCMKEKKGSLAGAALKDKIFAVGGGNGIECFSHVEMYDPQVGRWINTQSMLQKVNT